MHSKLKKLVTFMMLFTMLWSCIPPMTFAEQIDVQEPSNTLASEETQLTTPEPTIPPEPTVSTAPMPTTSAASTDTLVPDTTEEPVDSSTPVESVMVSYTPVPTVMMEPVLEGYRLQITDSGVTIIEYYGSDSRITVPSSVGNLPIITIATGAFKDNDTLESISITEGIKTIKNGAFDNCINLLSLCLPQSIENISDNPIINCPKVTISAPTGSIAHAFAVVYSSQQQCQPVLPTGLETTATPMPTAINNIDGQESSISISVDPLIDSPDNTMLQSIQLSASHTSIKVGESVTVNATFVPEEVIKKLSWSSSSASIANVDSYGQVTGMKTGTATITASTTDGSGKKASIKITVYRPVTGLSISKSSINLIPGKTFSLSASISPRDATNKTVLWSSSDTSVATVTSTGMVKAIGIGTATISAEAAYSDPESLSAECTVAVTNAVQTIQISTPLDIIRIGESTTLSATILPEDALQTLSWISSNPLIATVDLSGNVIGIKPGTVTITASAMDGSGKKAGTRISVYRPVTGLLINKSSVNLIPGKTLPLMAIISPSNATNKTVLWSSSDTSVATVSSAGIVKTIGVGTATISAEAAYSDPEALSAECTVSITNSVQTIQMSTPQDIISIGESISLSATILPEDAFQTLSWISSSPSIASVDLSGNVIGIKPGTATITASAMDGSGKKASKKITVYRPVTGLSISKSSINLIPGKTYSLSASISPRDASNKTVLWSSSDTSVATVTSTGVVKTIAVGTAIITAVAAFSDPDSISVECEVNVTNPIQSIDLSSQKNNIYTGERITLSPSIMPTDAYQTLAWVSSNPTVAAVDSSGIVTGIKLGTTIITGSALDGSGKKATMKITVYRPVTGLVLNISSVNMIPGKSISLITTVTPSNAANKTVLWSSSNTDVATVSSMGVVEAVGVGTATITAVAAYSNPDSLSAECCVNVNKAVQSIQLNAPKTMIKIGESTTISASVLPEDAEQALVWQSSSPSVATVDASGKVTGMNPGSSTITANAIDGSDTRSSQIINVYRPVTGLLLNKSSINLSPGNKCTLYTTALPYNSTNQSVIWSSSDTSIANVTSSGIVEGVGVGTATITAVAVYSEPDSVSAECTVTVTKAVQTIELQTTKNRIKVLENITITASILPTDALQRLSWSSSNPAIATVDSSGNVSGLNPGATTITASAMDGSDKKASQVINVYCPVTGLVLDESSIILITGGTLYLHTTITPNNSTDKTVLWSSSNNNIATVSSTGMVKAIGAGTATITAVAALSDPEALSAECVVNVTDAVQSIQLSAPKSIIQTGEGITISATVLPADAMQELTWDSLFHDIATVDESGNVHGNNPGTTTIWATAMDGSGKSGHFEITVIPEIPLAAPQNLHASNVKSNSITIEWDIDPDAYYYAIYQDETLVSTDGFGSSFTTGFHSFDNLVPNTQYNFKVAAVSRTSIIGLPSDVIHIQTLPEQLAAPTNLRYTEKTATSISLEWGSVTGAVYYKLYRDNICIADVYDTHYNNTGLASYTDYIFRVAAVSSDGKVGELSNGIYVTTRHLSAPSNVHATSITSNSITVAWNAVSGASSYYVFCDYDIIGTTGGTSYTIPNLSASTKYYIIILGIEANGQTGYDSDVLSIITLTSGGNTQLSAPQSLRSTAVSTNSIRMEWNSVSGASYYKFYRDGSFVANVYDLNYTISSLSSDTQYGFKVSAVSNSGVEGLFSDNIYVRTQQTQLAAPQNLHYTAVAANSIRMEWNSVSGASYYKFYRDGNFVTNVYDTTYTSNGLSSDTQYGFRVSAVSSSGVEGAFTVNIYVRTSTGGSSQLPAPQNLHYTNVSSNSITMEWNNVSGASYFRLYANNIIIGSPSGTSCVCSNLNADTEYIFKVYAIDLNGLQGLQSECISVRTSKGGGAGSGSVSAAIEWAKSKIGQYIDYDGVYGAQCVDLIKAYYIYLGVSAVAGNGKDYATNSLPNGWSRYAGALPSPGDIAIFGSSIGTYGHVAIVVSATNTGFTSIDQNWPIGGAVQYVNHNYNGYWGIIRPQFR